MKTVAWVWVWVSEAYLPMPVDGHMGLHRI